MMNTDNRLSPNTVLVGCIEHNEEIELVII
jgi:hypothetical protein